MKDVIASMYGLGNAPSAPAKQPLRENAGVLSVKIQDKKLAKIKIGEKEVALPTVEYVRELDDMVESLTKETKRLASDNKKLSNTINSLVRDMTALQKSMKNKMDRFD